MTVLVLTRPYISSKEGRGWGEQFHVRYPGKYWLISHAQFLPFLLTRKRLLHHRFAIRSSCCSLLPGETIPSPKKESLAFVCGSWRPFVKVQSPLLCPLSRVGSPKSSVLPSLSIRLKKSIQSFTSSSPSPCPPEECSLAPSFKAKPNTQRHQPSKERNAWKAATQGALRW